MSQMIWELDQEMGHPMGNLWPLAPRDPQSGKPIEPDGIRYFSLEQAAAFTGTPVALMRRRWLQVFSGILGEDEPLIAASSPPVPPPTPQPDGGTQIELDPKSPEGIRTRLEAVLANPRYDLWRAWKYPHLDDDNWLLFISLCQDKALNVCSNQVYADFVHDEKTAKPKLVLIVSIEGLRLLAERTGQRAGADAAKFECDEDGNPVRCTVTVYRRTAAGERVAFVGEAEAVEYLGVGLQEYAQRMPRHRLKKFAEAQAYRQGFPEIGDVYTPEEIESVREQHRNRPQARPAQSAGRDGIDEYVDDVPVYQNNADRQQPAGVR